MRAVARAQRSTVRLLRRMLALQATDKDFLLAAIQRVSDGGECAACCPYDLHRTASVPTYWSCPSVVAEWLYSPRGAGGAAEGEGEGEGHTGRYVRSVRQPSNSCFQLERGAPRTPAPGPAPAPAPAAEDGDSDNSFSWCASQGP